MIKRFKKWYASGDLLKSNASRLQDWLFYTMATIGVIALFISVIKILIILTECESCD